VNVAFILYDLETTGLNRRFDQILQFAAVRTDADLNETHRFDARSRLSPHIVPSPQALLVTGHTLAEINSPFRQSHYSMVCEIVRVLAAWCPATFLGYNSIRFDEEFLRQAFYQCLHPIYLTNRNGNARADVLNLMRAATTLYPTVLRAGLEPDGRPTHRLGAMAAANGVVSRALHDAVADVDAMLALCRLVRAGAPDLWSTFLRFSSKAAVVDFVRDEDAFAYFDYFGRPQVMHFLTRVGINPKDGNSHYCLDLASDIDQLRKMEAGELSWRLTQEPRPIRRLKVNASPLLYPLWDIEPDRFADLTEDELARRALSVRGDPEFMVALTRAAISIEPTYSFSEHVEEQIYGGNFISDADAALSRHFHSVPWHVRETLTQHFQDDRLKRLARRLLLFESPDVLSDWERKLMLNDIAARRRGEGRYASVPWTTISNALRQFDNMDEQISAVLQGEFRTL
jgi:exodeoxyribonuclease I